MDTIELYGHPQVLWPDHCVQGSPGSELVADMPWHRVQAIIRKATHPAVDSYSAFRNNWDASGGRPPTGLAGLLTERGIERVFLCGLARDYCVRWSAEDAVAAGFSTGVIWDLTRSVDPSGDADIRRALDKLGVLVIESGDLEV
jgi:nicotinamidase/pyrazinamidase